MNLGLYVVQKPEKLTNNEIGLKGKFLDGRLQLQAAAYYAIWSDQLNNRSIVFPDQPPPLGIGTAQQVQGLANTGETALKGLEIEVVSKPVNHVELTFAAAMTDSSIRSFQTPAISQITGLFGDDFRGKQLPESSKYCVNGGAQYGTPVRFLEGGAWFARADLSWKDKQYLDAANLTWIKARTVVNLRTGIARGPLSVDVFANNAFNDKNYVGVIQRNVQTPTFSSFGNQHRGGRALTHEMQPVTT